MNNATKYFWMTQKRKIGWRLGPLFLFSVMILWILNKSLVENTLFEDEEGFDFLTVTMSELFGDFVRTIIPFSQRTFYLIGIIYLGLVIPYVFIQSHYHIRGNSVIEIAKYHPFNTDAYFRLLWKAYLPYYVIGILSQLAVILLRFDPLFILSGLVVLLIPPLIFLGQKATFIRLAAGGKKNRIIGLIIEFLLSVSYFVVFYNLMRMCLILVSEFEDSVWDFLDRRAGL
ncbi:MAG: hypothetical protein J5825_04785 [Lachnospiraceae bacterium]|nr:hypothetical protein [Lachnospiraceae bacterium]